MVTTADVAVDEALFSVPVDVAVRTDSRHTDFATRFAAELQRGWWDPNLDAPSVPKLQLVALVLCVPPHLCGAGTCCHVVCAPRRDCYVWLACCARVHLVRNPRGARYERFYVARSFWQPYWDVCPPDFNFLPPHFSDECVACSSACTATLQH